MNEIPRAKKLAVAQSFLMGDTYSEIEEETGVSHGSIVNIVKELENGKLNIPGCTPDHVIDLHQLSLDLKKKELTPSQSLLGLLLFERCNTLGVKMEQLNLWSELVTKFTSTEFPKEDFCIAAMRLYQLENSQGKPFEILTEEYKKTKDQVDKLRDEVDSLVARKEQLVKEIKPLSIQVDNLTKSKGELESQRHVLKKQTEELKSEVAEKGKEKSNLAKEIKELQHIKTKLSAEVDGKEESLARLNAIGFLDEDLIRLRNIVERIASSNKENSKEVKEKFFIAVGSFKDLAELDKSKKYEMEKLLDITKKKSLLDGEIQVLEKRKAILLGEIGQAATSVAAELKGIGEKAASELQLQVEDIRGSFNAVITDAIKTAGVISDMKAEVTKGEKSEKGLKDFIAEVNTRLGRN